MGKKYLLGVDIGTGEAKGLLCDIHGKILDFETRAYDIRIPRPGYAEHDPVADWWASFVFIVKQLLDRTEIDPAEIAGIGCSSIACGLTAVSKQGEPMRNAILYGIDLRSQKEIDELNRVIGKDKIKAHVGRDLSADSFGPKILWIKNNEPDIFNNAHFFTFVQGFLNYKLTGNNFIDVYSAGFAEPMFNQRTNDWDASMCSYIVDMEKLPEICWPTDVIGSVTREAAYETGLKEGTPVICGTTDAGAEALSVGIMRPGDLMIMFGSTTFIDLVCDTLPEEDTPLWKANFLFPDSYCLLSATATTGSLVKWLKNTLARDLMQKETETGCSAYESMLEGIDEIEPGSENLYLLPYFAGERMPINDPQAKGVIFGLTLAHGRKHLVRAAIEGIGYALKDNLDAMRKLGYEVNKAVAVGGGTKSKAWMKIMADISGCELLLPEVTIGASYGDAMLAGLGTGVIGSRDELRKWVKEKDYINPDIGNTEIYEKHFKIFKAIYDAEQAVDASNLG
jgi:xylulokinase